VIGLVMNVFGVIELDVNNYAKLMIVFGYTRGRLKDMELIVIVSNDV
jgi:hypothetical protein